MAYIGKDGKDDVAHVVSTGYDVLKASLTSINAPVPRRTFFRAVFEFDAPPTEELVAKHLDFVRKYLAFGAVDAYGGVDEDTRFVVFLTADKAEAEEIAKCDPLVKEGNATLTVAKQ